MPVAYSTVDENDWAALPDRKLKGNGVRHPVEDAIDVIQQGGVVSVPYSTVRERHGTIRSFGRRAAYRGLRLDKRWTDKEIAFKLRS